MAVESTQRGSLPRLGFLRTLTGIFAMQVLITMAVYSLPVIVPVAAGDLGIEPESVGFMVACIYGISMFSGLFSGELVDRFGATDVFRLMVALTALAVLLLMFSSLWAIVGMVLLLGAATGPMNPTGSQVLSKVVPARFRPLVFSIKQCATPGGGVLAGALLPPMMLVFGWQTAMLVIPAVALVFLPLAGAMGLGRRDPQRTSIPVSLSNILASIISVYRSPAMARLTGMAFCLALSQMALTAYLVVYLWSEVGFSEQLAGLVFAALHISGIASRIILGAIADRLVSASTILIAICIVLGLSLLTMANFNAGWHVLLVGAVVVIAGGTGNGWVGLYFAEVTRLAPADKVAELTGASQFYAYLGLLLGPLLFGLLLNWTDSYRFTFLTFAALPLLIGFWQIKSSFFK